MRVIHRSSRALLTSIVSLGLTSAVYAQTPPASTGSGTAAAVPATQPFPEISRAAKDSADANAIDSFIKVGIANITGGNPGAMKEGRERLVNELPSSTATTSATSNAAFADAYTKAIRDQVGPLLKDQNLRVRLNAAIVIARVAGRADNTLLADLILQMLQDPNDAIALWGMKGATAILPRLVHAKVDSPLLKGAIPAAVATHHFPGIAQEAYLALTMGGSEAAKKVTEGLITPQVIDQLHEVMKVRLDHFQQGASDEPLTDKYAIAFLSYKEVWGLQSDAEKAKSISLTAQFLQVAAQKLPAATNINDREQLTLLIRTTSGTVYVIADYMGDANIKQAAQPLTHLNSSVKADQMQAYVGTLIAELRKTYSDIPQMIAAPTSAPAASAANSTTTK